MGMSLQELMRSFRRSWVHHTGMQLATLTVLTATFAVVVFTVVLTINLKRLLTHWGESLQVSVYLADSVTDENLRDMKSEFSRQGLFKAVKYISKESATEVFKDQMASYAPDLLDDKEFANPFPASFQLSVRDDVALQQDLSMELEKAAAVIAELPGVEDVSYGQGWIKSYAAFVGTLSTSGWVIGGILLLGSLFVVGNSVRASITARRDEISILELVGATNQMIRLPFVFEGIMIGGISAALALLVNYGFYAWEIKLFQASFSLTRIVPELRYFDLLGGLGVLGAGAFIGAVGAYLTIRNINDGWTASQTTEG